MYTDGAIRSCALSWDTSQFTHLLNGPAEGQFSLCYDRHQIANEEHHKYRLLLFIWRLPSILSASWVVHLYELLSAPGRLWTTESPFTDRLIYIADKNSKIWLNCKFQSSCNLNFILFYFLYWVDSMCTFEEQKITIFGTFLYIFFSYIF